MAAGVRLWQKRRVDNHQVVPADLVTASASGLSDPHISLAAAYYQAPHIALLRQFTIK